MSYSDDISFDADQGTPTGTSDDIIATENKMVTWLMRRGIAKTQTQAQMILLGVTVVAILIGIGAWVLLTPKNSPPPSQAQLDAMLHPQGVPTSKSSAHF